MNALRTILVGTVEDGCLLSLIAAGFVVVFRATRVVSFCQGLFMVLGALLFASSLNHGYGLYGSLALAVVVTALIGAAVYRLILARIAGAAPFVTAIATIGIATAGEGICILLWGDQNVTLQNPPLGGRFDHVIGALVARSEILVIILTIVLFGALIFGIQRTKFGLRMRAVADQPRLAAYSGVRVGLISSGAWAVAAAGGALAGTAFVLTTQPSPDDVYSLGLSAFPAILLGGFDSISGAIVGGLAIALIENFTVYNFGGQWQDVVAYLVLLAVLVVRPSGLFGRSEVVRL